MGMLEAMARDSRARFGTAALALAFATFAAACAGAFNGYSTSSYAVAGGFAAAAGAMQIAESAASSPPVGSCGLQTCGGCCDAKGTCLIGAGDSACGAGGATCADCTLLDGRCAGGGCNTVDPGSAVGVSANPSSAAACEIASCPRCVLGMPCCSAVGACACSIGNLCP